MQTNRFLAENIKEKIQQNLPQKAEDIIDEIVKENRRIICR